MKELKQALWLFCLAALCLTLVMIVSFIGWKIGGAGEDPVRFFFGMMASLFSMIMLGWVFLRPIKWLTNKIAD
jgi:hypothetical protein